MQLTNEKVIQAIAWKYEPPFTVLGEFQNSYGISWTLEVRHAQRNVYIQVTHFYNTNDYYTFKLEQKFNL